MSAGRLAETVGPARRPPGGRGGNPLPVEGTGQKRFAQRRRGRRERQGKGFISSWRSLRPLRLCAKLFPSSAGGRAPETRARRPGGPPKPGRHEISRRFGLTLALLLALPARARAADFEGPAVFELAAADGRTVFGALREIGDDWTVRLRASRVETVSGAEVVSLRRSGTALPAPPAGAQVVLTDGGRLPGTVEKIANDRLFLRPDFPVRTAADKPLGLPLSRVAVVWLAPPRDAADPRLLLRKLAGRKRPRDVLWLRNGDRIEGTLLGLDGELFRVEGEGKKVTEVPRARVALVALNTELASRARPKGIYGHLVLANGARLEITSARLRPGDDTLHCRLPAGDAFTVPADQVAALDPRQGCATYLSDLKPLRTDLTPYFGVRWPPVADGSAAGRDLRLAGGTYDKGLGTHSRCRLTYRLPAGSARFEALVGLDEQTGRGGRAKVRVLVDGREADLGGRKELSLRDRPVKVRVGVAGGKELTLVVDFGRFGDVRADVDWADARLIRAPKNK